MASCGRGTWHRPFFSGLTLLWLTWLLPKPVSQSAKLFSPPGYFRWKMQLWRRCHWSSFHTDPCRSTSVSSSSRLPLLPLCWLSVLFQRSSISASSSSCLLVRRATMQFFLLLDDIPDADLCDDWPAQWLCTQRIQWNVWRQDSKRNQRDNVDWSSRCFLCCFSSSISAPIWEVDCLSKGGGGKEEGREEV